jgi:hypothetical protein
VDVTYFFPVREFAALTVTPGSGVPPDLIVPVISPNAAGAALCVALGALVDCVGEADCDCGADEAGADDAEGVSPAGGTLCPKTRGVHEPNRARTMKRPKCRVQRFVIFKGLEF